MHKYQPQTKNNIKEMLDKIGAKNKDELFQSIPKSIKNRFAFNLPQKMDDIKLTKHMEKLSKLNNQVISFQGNGAFDHYVPSAVKNITSRQEFLTSYTPYQPEVSQGTLQYIFEYQSIVCNLTGMDVSNASMYDGTTATAEAVFMAYSITKKEKILISSTVDEKIINVVSTYAKYRGLSVEILKEKDGLLDINELELLGEDHMGLVIQSPNKYGLIENSSIISSMIHSKKGLMILNREATALPILKTPSSEGADISCGDMQAFGIPVQAGGPYIGYLATKNQYLRKLPGRICGMTTDSEENVGFVLTLQAREQHIRRDKANSNICSNQSLNALAVVVYTSLLGKKGLTGISQTCLDRAAYLKEKLLTIKSFEDPFSSEHFKEFTLKYNKDAEKLNKTLLSKGFLGPKIHKNNLLTFALTEKRSKEEIDLFIEEIKKC
jgi:glycine dehydrogenase subunit 1